MATLTWIGIGLCVLQSGMFSGLNLAVFGVSSMSLKSQAYFSRHALKMASRLRPVLRFWQFALYPLANPTALLLDAWLGKEGLQFMRESEIRAALKIHTASPESEVGRVEGIGALNFLSIDDVIDQDLILYWGRDKRIITGGDLLGRLMREIPARNTSGETTILEPPDRAPTPD